MSGLAVLDRPGTTSSDAGWIMIDSGPEYATSYASQQAMRFGPREYSGDQLGFIKQAARSRASLPESALPLDN
jgi:hypothetical protein